MKVAFEQILRFAAFSASTLVGTAVDTLVLWLCSHYLLVGTYWGENLLSPALSFECAVFANYLVAYYGVWRDRTHAPSEQAASRLSFVHRFLTYNGTCVAGFLVKMAFLLFFRWLLHIDVVWCNLIALCFSGLFNYVMNEFVVFRKKH